MPHFRAYDANGNWFRTFGANDLEQALRLTRAQVDAGDIVNVVKPISVYPVESDPWFGKWCLVHNEMLKKSYRMKPFSPDDYDLTRNIGPYEHMDEALLEAADILEEYDINKMDGKYWIMFPKTEECEHTTLPKCVTGGYPDNAFDWTTVGTDKLMKLILDGWIVVVDYSAEYKHPELRFTLKKLNRERMKVWHIPE